MSTYNGGSAAVGYYFLKDFLVNLIYQVASG
jgi:hypothetical protein